MDSTRRIRNVNILYLTTMLLVVFLGSAMQSRSIRWGLLATEIVLILLPAWLYLRYIDPSAKERLRLRRPHWRSALGGLLIGLGMGPLAALLEVATRLAFGYAVEPPPSFYPLTVPEAVLHFIAVALVPAFCEEFLFRGVIQPAYEARGPRLALFVGGLLFAFFHQRLQGLIPILPISFVLGYVLWRSGSLAVSMLTHLGNNALFAAVAILAGLQQTSWVVTALLTVPVGAVLTATGFWLLDRPAERSPRSAQAPDAAEGTPGTRPGSDEADAAAGTGPDKMASAPGAPSDVAAPAPGTVATPPTPAAETTAEAAAKRPVPPLARWWPLFIAAAVYLLMASGEYAILSPYSPVPAGPVQFRTNAVITPARWTYELRDPLGNPIGTAVYELTDDGSNLVFTWRVEHEAFQAQVGANGVYQSDAVTKAGRAVWDRETLHVVSLDATFNDLSWSAAAQGDGLLFTVRAPDGAEYSLTLPPETLFPDEWPWRLAFTYFELGVRAAMPIARPWRWDWQSQRSEPALETVRLLVSGGAPVATPAGRFAAWQVRVNGHLTAWYDGQRPHTLVQYADGGVTYVLRTYERPS